MKPKVLITRKLPEKVLNILQEKCEVDLNDKDRGLSKKELKRRLRGKNGMLCLLTDIIDKEVIEASSGLRIIANCAVGFNNIDLEAASARNIMVTNTPGVLTETTADLAWALLMAIARRIVEADKFTRKGKFKEWRLDSFLGEDIYAKTLGIIGMGRIGQAVARRTMGFGMKVLYTNTKPNREVEKQFWGVRMRYVSLDELLRESDFVTIHTPLTEETRHLIGERELGLMKRTAYLVNTSRGPVVDERALARALKKKKIAGAGLDVYENEPKITRELIKTDSVILLPHIGSASTVTRTKMAAMAVSNLLAGLEGKVPQNLVNKEVLYSKGDARWMKTSGNI